MIWNPTKDYAGAMTQHSHQTAPTQFVNTAGVRFAYRRFGKSTGVPLVFNMHFTGTMNGGKDVIIYSVNSFLLQQYLPNAQLILYPDANHGSQYQYPKRFVQQVSLFLSEEEAR
jgi:hypothetical protein